MRKRSTRSRLTFEQLEDRRLLAVSLVKDIKVGSADSNLNNLYSNGSLIFFGATDGVSGMEPYVSDGTSDGTFRLADTDGGLAGGNPNLFRTAGNTTFFAAYGQGVGRELWKTDGTVAGTSLLKDINPTGSSLPEGITAVGTRVFFSANDGVNGLGLWTSDGTASGTVLLKALSPGASGEPFMMPVGAAGGKFVFRYSTAAYGEELWVSDGTVAGTTLLKDIRTGVAGSFPQDYIVVGSKIYFSASDGTGFRLWETDGTTSGTKIVGGPADRPTGVSGLTSYGSQLYFRGITDATGSEVWKYDTAMGGDPMPIDLNPGSGSSSFSYLTATATGLFIGLNQSTIINDVELWFSDGTVEGTRLVKDIRPEVTSTPIPVALINGQFYFSADDGVHGRELWISDGTEAGTKMVSNPDNSAATSAPDHYAVLGDSLVFGQRFENLGVELVKFSAEPTLELAPTTIRVVTGDLVISDNAGKEDRLKISFDGEYYTVENLDGLAIDVVGIPSATGSGTSTVAISKAVFDLDGKVIVRANAGDDKLTLDVSTLFAHDVDYQGYLGTDDLTLTGGSVHTVTNNYTRAGEGVITFDSTGLGTMVRTIAYAGTEPVVIDVETNNLTFNLPSGGPTAATLEDEGSFTNSMSQLFGTFGDTTFVNPSSLLKINPGTAMDSIAIAQLFDFKKNLTVGSITQPFGQVKVVGETVLDANHDFNVFAAGEIAFTTSFSDWITSGTGAINLTTSRNIVLSDGSSLRTVDGGITLSANQQATPTNAEFVGIKLDGAYVDSTGRGNLNFFGRGGSAGNQSVGVWLQNNTFLWSSSTDSSAGTITILGTGGANSDGVRFAAGISSDFGDVLIQGEGGAGSGGHGVHVAGSVSSWGTGENAATITIDGIGSGESHGVWLSGVNTSTARINSVDGDIFIQGQAARAAGVSLSFAQINSNGAGDHAAKITITGIGGIGDHGHGVHIAGDLEASDSEMMKITSLHGDMRITGLGGGQQGSLGGHHGVKVEHAQIISNGFDEHSSNITIDGHGGIGTDGGNTGVSISNSIVTGSAGDIAITGDPGESGLGSNFTYGLHLDNVRLGTNGSGSVNLTSDSMSILPSAFGAYSSKFVVRTKTPGRAINLGGADSDSQLGLNGGEIDSINSITFGKLIIGDSHSGNITISDTTTLTANNLELRSGGDIVLTGGIHVEGGDLLLVPGASGAVKPTFTGVDVEAYTISIDGKLRIKIDGLLSDAEYTRLIADSEVDLTGVELQWTGSYTPTDYSIFGIVENMGSGPIIGTFNNLPEGTVLPNFLGSSIDARITYLAGDGNDVAIIVGQPARIQGLVFHDQNFDSVQNADEPGLANSTVYVDANKNGQFDLDEPSAITDENGLYLIDDSPIGEQHIRFVKQPRWQQTLPAFEDAYVLSLVGGVTRTEINFASVLIPEISLNSSDTAVNEDAGIVALTAQLDQAVGYVVSVPIQFVSDTAQSGSDFQPSSHSFTFLPGQTTATIYINIIDDRDHEITESFLVTLGNSTDVSYGIVTENTVTILDNDAVPELSFLTSSQIATEGASVRVKVRLNATSHQAVTVPLTFSGSATQGADYLIGNSTITIPAGHLVGETTLTIVDDTVGEPTELIYVGLGTLAGATPSSKPSDPTTHIVTIPQNDAPSVSFVLASQSKSETAGLVQIEVRLSHGSAQSITVPFSISGTAGASDRTIAPTSPLTFVPGELSKIITVNIVNDTTVESNETLQIDLGTPSGGAVFGSMKRHILTIIDNDTAMLEFSAASQTKWESAGNVAVNVSLTNPVAFDMPFTLYVAAGDSAGQAKLQADFTILGTLIPTNPQTNSFIGYIQGFIPANSTSVNVPIIILNDSVNESSEQVTIVLLGGGVAAHSSKNQHTITIKDNDPLISISAGTKSFTEGNQSVPFTVSLSAPTQHNVIVPLSTVNGTAKSPSDYTHLNSSVTIPAGQTSVSGSFTIKDDLLDESNETVVVKLGTPTSASGSPKLTSASTATFTIVDNESSPGLSYSTTNGSIAENNIAKDITVTLGSVSGQDVYVTLSFTGTAIRNTHYTVSGLDSSLRLKIPAGTSSATFKITTKNNLLFEGNLSAIVTMASATNATLPSASSRQRTFTIVDDESRPAPPVAPIAPSTVGINTNGGGAIGAYNTSPTTSSSGTGSTSFPPGYIAISHGSQGFINGSVAFFDANFNGIADFLDINGNGIQDGNDPDEPYVLTELDGTFALIVGEAFDRDSNGLGNGLIDAYEGRWVVTGGLDISTDLPVRVPLTAPMGFYAVTPLSTLLEQMIRLHGIPVADAEGRLLEALDVVVGGTENFSLAQLNLLRGIESGNTSAASLYAASVKISNTVLQIAELFSSVPGAPPLTYFSDMVYAALAQRIIAPGATLSLRSQPALYDLITSIPRATGVSLNEAVSQGAATIIAAGNQAIDDSEFTVDPEGNQVVNLEYAAKLIRVKKVMQGEASIALGKVTGGITSVASVVADYTGASLQSKIDGAVPNVLVPPSISVTHATSIQEGNSGQVSLQFTVRISGDFSSPVSVSYTTADDVATSSNGDYVPVSGTLNWVPGDNTERIISVPVNGNNLFESDKSIKLLLTDVIGAAITSQVAYGWILNDDALELNLPSAGGRVVLELDGEHLGALLNDEMKHQGFQTNALMANINGQSNVDNTLVLEFANDTYRSDTITFNGGSGGSDSVQIRGGNFASITQTLVNSTDGRTEFRPSPSSEEQSQTHITLNWLALEPFLIDVGSVEQLIFVLPAGVTDAVLEDADPSDQIQPGMMQLRSPSGAFETTTFSNPSNSLIIRGGLGADSIFIASLDPDFSAAIIIEGGFSGSDSTTVSLQSDVHDLTVVAAKLEVDGSRTVSGDLTLANNTTLQMNIDAAQGNDFLEVTGTFYANGASLVLKGAYVPNASDHFTLINANSIGDTFALYAEGTTVVINGVYFVISYIGSEVTLSPGIPADIVAPRIVDVIVAGTSWSPSFIDAVDGAGMASGNNLGMSLARAQSVSNFGINRIYVIFSEDVRAVSSNILQVLGSATVYVPSLVTYDPLSFIATITLATPIGFDKIRVALDDSITDAAGNLLDGDSNGVAGGIFDFRFNVNPGDINGDGRVFTTDLAAWQMAFGAIPGQSNYNPAADLNGDGRVFTTDLALWQRFFGNNLTGLTDPPASSFTSSANTRMSAKTVDKFFKGGFDEEDDDEEDSLELLVDTELQYI